MPLPLSIPALLATLALAGAAGVPAPPDQPPVRYREFVSHMSHLWYYPDEDATPLQQRGQRIYGRVLAREIGRCTFTSYVPRPTRRTPSLLLQLTLPVLNRAPTPADRPLPAMREEIHGLYVEWTRQVTTPDGHRLMIAPTVDREQQTLPTRCLRRIHARLQRSLAGEPAVVRRAALQAHRARRAAYPPRLGPRIETVSLLGPGAPGDEFQTIAHAEVPRLLRGGAFGTVPAADPARSLVGGIVPDEVESVTLTLGRPEWDRRTDPPAPPPLRMTLPVHDEVVATEVERPSDNAQVLDAVLHRPNASSHPEIRVIR